MIMQKRGQETFSLSFGMIFSIILIISFLALAMFVIVKFLGLQRDVTAGVFINELQKNVDDMWKGSNTFGSQEIKLSLPNEIEEVCFVDFSKNADNKESFYDDIEIRNHNLFFYPLGSSPSIESSEIEHIDISEMTANENPYCVISNNGDLSLIIKRELGGNSILIERISD